MTAIRETYRGNKIVVRKGRQWGTVEMLINGQSLGSYMGSAEQWTAHARGTIDHFHASPESYTNGNGDITGNMVAES